MGATYVTFGRENTEEPKPRYDDEPDWDDIRLCPECEGRGWIGTGDKKELCLTCDGLGVIYDD